MTGRRLPTGGTLIDRHRPVRVTFAGRQLSGFEGDTLASAMIANGVSTVARSFKYHRPRGVVSAGPEEPSALVTLGDDGRAEPNTKAPMVPLHDGLVAHGQNAWPALGFDAMAINGLAGPLFSAGFYYKTFMGGPRGTWTKLFEPVIRRAAGMGRAPSAPDPDRYETMHAHCDVLVVGGGPAGLGAATAAAKAGAHVLIADERQHLGGHLLGSLADLNGNIAPRFAAECVENLLAAGATVLPRTTVYGHYDGQFAAVERVADFGAPGALRQRHWLIRPQRVILATGAIERPIVFPGNDRPGVMLAEAVRAYLNAYAAAPGERAVVFTAHDGAYAAVRDLASAGIAVAAVVDARGDVPDPCRAIAANAGAELFPGHVVAAATGGRRVRAVAIKGPRGRTIAADTLAVSAGWVPTIHLTAQAGGKPIWDETIAAFRPGALPDNWYAAGAVDGTFGTAHAFASGVRAGTDAARALGRTGPEVPIPVLDDELLADRPALLFRVPGRGKAFVDLQHDVTAADVVLAYDEGFTVVEHLKRYTTLGMATDQGKTSNLNGLAMMAEAAGIAIPAAGSTRFRPPTSPVALGALAGAESGTLVRPVRRTPMHDWHVKNGAEMVAVGAFLRPRAYLRAGENVRDAYIREATTVRQSVGVVDVSTLGKIEVAGPDAAEFLNRVYVNGFTKLPVGKARYGVMLRDDGFAFDDGTTWRLAEHRYLMTTTTQNAAAVLSRLEFLLATAWPELKVHLTSVSEEWAGMAVAGPKSRPTLATLIEDLDFSDAAFPFMAVRQGTAGSVPVLLARLSFSGEMAYELYCGAHYGTGVWEAVLAAGSAHDIAPYGTEAMGTLRIEKGHVTGSEIDGRTTLHDLGLNGLASTKKPFVGATMMQRKALTCEARHQLVGLRSTAGAPIKPGAHLIGADGGSEGHVTATTYSPELGAEIALALLARGAGRHGERLTATYPLKGINIEVEVVSPHFVDPEGSRVRG